MNQNKKADLAKNYPSTGRPSSASW